MYLHITGVAEGTNIWGWAALIDLERCERYVVKPPFSWFWKTVLHGDAVSVR